MSDKDPVTENADDAAIEETTTDDAPAPDASFDEPGVKKSKSSGAGVAWLALLLSCAALSYIVFDYLRGDVPTVIDDQSATDIAALQSTVRAVRDSLTTLEQSISALSTLDGTRSAEMDALERQFEERLRQLDAVSGRMMSLEGTVSSLQGISTGARSAWLLAEAEYYMQIANAQLQLAGNPHLASLALRLADERVLQLADPGLMEVRRALSDELRALETMEKPDTEGITHQLASLAGAVDDLPLRHEIVLAEPLESGIDPELEGVDRAMASLGNALGNVVSVRRTDEAMQPLIAPEAQYFLRANLALQLQAARLAVLRNEEAIFNTSMDEIADWLATYYDTGNTGVQSAQETIAEIRGGVFAIAVPDISESLRLLRQFNAFTRAADDEQARAPQTEESADDEPTEEPQQ